MDVAYDHVQEEAFAPTTEEASGNASSSTADAPATLNTELRSAFQNISTTQWGNTIGGWFSSARKQGETLYHDLQKEASDAQEQATKGLSSLKEQVVNRTRGLSANTAAATDSSEATGEGTEPSNPLLASTATAGAAAAEAEALEEPPVRSSTDIVTEAGSLVASLRSTAASTLKDLQRAEDAADEALLKFGMNIRNFLRDAVVITAPDDTGLGAESEVLFETHEPGTGKKVFHSTRLDAQLHAIHTRPTTFTDDPATGETWEQWSSQFDVDSKTAEISKDLQKYDELRGAMEQLVPEKVDYKNFWMRYYFLRQAVEEEEKRRREVLKGATTGQEEVAWDEDSDDEEKTSTPNPPTQNHAASASTTTLHATALKNNLKPASPRRSHEDESKSVADSDASYDMVSGATSRAMGSPKDEKKEHGKDDSDDDWE